MQIPETTPFRKFGRGVFGLLLAAAVVGGYVYFKSKPSASVKESASGRGGGRPETPPASVAVATTRQGDMPVYLQGLGAVTALRTVTVHSRVDGELIKVLFTEGQPVQPGDLLAEIDPRPYLVQLKQAEGQLIRDQALLENARLDLKRYQTLLEQDSIAQQQTVTQAALVKQYEGTVEMDQAQVDNAKLQLTYAKITSPIAGRVGLRLVDQGNIVHAADTNGMLVITQIEPIAVVFTLPEDSVPSVMRRWRQDQNIAVDAYDRAGKRKITSGKVTAIDNQIDTTTGTLKLKAQFANTDHSLFANQFVNVKMHLDTLKNSVLAANAAIQHGVNGDYVYVIKDDDSVTLKSVKVAGVDGDTVAIAEGVGPGEKLVVDGADKLREGDRVRVVKVDNIAPDKS